MKRVAGRRVGEVGLTLLEILIATSVFGTALLALGYYHTNALIGTRQDGQIVLAKQLAISIVEDWRDSIRKDANQTRLYDGGHSGTRDVSIAGSVHTGGYTITPWQLDSGGALVPVPVGQEPHLFQVDVRVAVSDTAIHTYSTLVHRTPSQ